MEKKYTFPILFQCPERVRPIIYDDLGNWDSFWFEGPAYQRLSVYSDIQKKAVGLLPEVPDH